MALFNPKPVDRFRPSGRTVGRQYQSWIIFLMMTGLFFGGIGTRLVYLQLIDGKNQRVLADKNRIRIIPKHPVRGNVFDRKGRIIATSYLTHSAFLWTNALQRPDLWEKTRLRLGQILNLSPKEIDRIIAESRNDPDTRDLIRLAQNITPEQITALEEYKNDLFGVEVDIEPIRYYPNGEIAGHVIGYTGEINETELKALKQQGYRNKDTIGKMGLELGLEKRLRGEWGGQEVEVNNAGKTMRILGEKKAKAGEDITLTLDLEVQKVAQRALGNRKGAIVVIDPRNGEVIALASNPSFDPNIFSRPIPSDVWKRLNDPNYAAFINRALRGFPPASTFKIVTATAGMESGKYPANVVLQTYPYLPAAGVRFYEWNKAGFGSIGYANALAFSSNTFFGQVGRGVTAPLLIDWSKRYGFGEKTGIELPEDIAGLVPNPEWKKKTQNTEWSVGDTINMSIGQGFWSATPLQVARMFCVPATGGYLVTPHLVKGGQPEQWRKSLHIAPENIAMIQTGLRRVVSVGTAHKLNGFNIPPMAGKSGTAEAPPRPNHTWFGAYAPYNNPQVVVLAFLEHSGGGGGANAGPIVVRVMQAYFQSQKPSGIRLENNSQ